jgi:hypothetical protein
MATRRWYMDQALGSYAGLNRVLHELTEEEVLACLKLESASSRRRSIVDRLISRAVRLRELTYVAQLRDKFLSFPR